MADRKSTIYDLEAEKIKEKIIIFAADTGGYTQKEVSLEIQASLDELTELIDTAGAEVVGRLVQNRDRIANDLYLGRGKVEELREMIYELGATGVCCDDELSPAQLMNLQDALDIKVMDRTMVILDIFAAHAGSYEGKLQVELAQLKFRATRLVGMRDSLSRLGGGIGTRGPGEKKLEIDRRVIRDRISRLKAELRNVESQRSQQRKQRQRSAVPVVGIVGYTNAGKSTLLNALTGAGVLQEDKLFATLDPTTRGYKLPGGQNILLTDTVGFIRKLPHHLVSAFKATLEELAYADLLLPARHGIASPSSMPALWKAKLTDGYTPDSYGYVTYPDSGEAYRGRGFVYTTGIPQDGFATLLNVDADAPLSDFGWEYLNKITDFCAENGIRLVLFTAPLPSGYLYNTENYQSYVDALRNFCAAHDGLEYWDFSLYKLQSKINLKIEDFSDAHHLNGAGAEKFTAILCKTIQRRAAGESIDDLFYQTVEEKLTLTPDDSVLMAYYAKLQDE